MDLNCNQGDVALIHDNRDAAWSIREFRLVTVVRPAPTNAEGRPTWEVYPVVMAPWVYNLPYGTRLTCADDAMLPLRPVPGNEEQLRAVLQDILLETL